MNDEFRTRPEPPGYPLRFSCATGRGVRHSTFVIRYSGTPWVFHHAGPESWTTPKMAARACWERLPRHGENFLCPRTQSLTRSGLRNTPPPPASIPSPTSPPDKPVASRRPRLSSRSRTGGPPRRPLAPRRSSVPRSPQQAVAHAFGSLVGRRVPLGGMPLTSSRQER